MGPAGQRLQLDPGGTVSGAVDRPPASLRRKPAFRIDVHLLAARARLLGQRGIDQPLVRLGHSDDQRPIELPRGPPGESLGEMARRARAFRHQQRARSVLVEPVDQLRPPAFAREAVEQPVEMVPGLGPALRREARRLVEDEGVGILVDYQVADEPRLVLAQRVALGLGPGRARRRELGRWNADFLPRLDPVARDRALPGQPQLARARPARDEVEAHLGHVPLEPAVESDPVVILGYGEGTDVAHAAPISES